MNYDGHQLWHVIDLREEMRSIVKFMKYCQTCCRYLRQLSERLRTAASIYFGRMPCVGLESIYYVRGDTPLTYIIISDM